jgi:hypothetical protein
MRAISSSEELKAVRAAPWMLPLFEASFSGLSFDNVFADDIVIGASGPIPAFASACSILESKCGTQKDRYQLIDSTGAFEFDI